MHMYLQPVFFHNNIYFIFSCLLAYIGHFCMHNHVDFITIYKCNYKVYEQNYNLAPISTHVSKTSIAEKKKRIFIVFTEKSLVQFGGVGGFLDKAESSGLILFIRYVLNSTWRKLLRTLRSGQAFRPTDCGCWLFKSKERGLIKIVFLSMHAFTFWYHYHFQANYLTVNLH